LPEEEQFHVIYSQYQLLQIARCGVLKHFILYCCYYENIFFRYCCLILLSLFFVAFKKIGRIRLSCKVVWYL